MWRDLAALAAVALFAGTLGLQKAAGGPRVMLKGVDRYRVREPLFECVRVILSYRGEAYTPAYIQGISGAAFRIAGPCPCAATCEWAMSTDHLIRLLGYECERLGVPAEGPEREAAWGEMLDRVKGEIRGGRPAIMWHAFTICENDVVVGFDEETGELFGRGSYDSMQTGDYARAPEDRALGSTCGGPHALLIGEKAGELDARSAEVGALRTAVLHAHGASAAAGFRVGLACYDNWAAAYRSKGATIAMALPNDWYELGILVSTRKAAADFLREIAPKHPEAAPHLSLAANHFARESAALAACEGALGDRAKEPSDEQRLRAADCLQQAREAYADGMGEVAAAVRAIEPVVWEVK